MKEKDYLDQAIIVTDENRGEIAKGTPPFFRVILEAASRLQTGVMILALPDGRILKYDSGEADPVTGIIHVHDWAMGRRTALGGTVGFYETYADGQWSTPNLTNALWVLSNNVSALKDRMIGNRLFKIFDHLAHLLNKNTKSGSKKNIMAHYDLGNRFYEQWLDPTMTYSSARFTEPGMALDKAQTEKYRALAKQIGLQSGETVLEIGSGWGGFAEFAAGEVGANVTGVTISQEQYDYARERLQRQGLNEKVDIQLRDYREIEGTFDKVASIEMFEAVGKEYWTTYFDKIRDSLKPSGRAGLQIITIRNDLYPDYERGVDFIQRYIFPGGMLPSPSVLRDYAGKSGLAVNESQSFGIDYADTLRQWHQRFIDQWGEISKLGFDSKFKKLWEFYLSYCEAGFRSGSTDVVQVALSKA